MAIYMLLHTWPQCLSCWVPAYVPVKRNERAAALRPAQGFPLPYGDLYRAIASADAKMGEVTSKAVCPGSCAHVWRRHNQITLTRLRTGYTNLTHSYFMSRGF